MAAFAKSIITKPFICVNRDYEDFLTAEHKDMTYSKFYLIAILSGLFFAGCASSQNPQDTDSPQKKGVDGSLTEAEELDALESAFASGNTDQVRAFYESPSNINRRDKEGRTPLHRAVILKDAELVQFFIDQGADIDAVDGEGQTALGICTTQLLTPDETKPKSIMVAKALVQGGADIHSAMTNGRSPALVAIGQDKELLSAIITEKTIESTDKNGNNALDLAFANPNLKKNAEAAAILIAADALPNKRESAALYAHFAPAVLNSNYDYRTDDGITPLHISARAGYIGFIEFLIEQGANVNTKNASGSTPLHEAVRSGNLEAITILLKARANINAQDARGNSVLHLAIRDIPVSKHKEIVELLLQQPDIDPSLWDEHGDSPLHAAIIRNEEVAILELLLKYGSDVNIRNIEGKVPLYVAVEENRPQYIPALLDSHSNVFAADSVGVTSYEKALRERQEALPYLITSATARQSDGSGDTILHMTIRNAGSIETIESILDKGARIDARNSVGDTALHIAVQRNNESVGTLLIERDANIFALNVANQSALYQAFHAKDGIRQWMLSPITVVKRDGQENTMLHYAAQWKMEASVISAIVKNGADIEAANATGETPLFAAVAANSPPTIDALLAEHAFINARDKMGNTTLHAAVRRNGKAAAEKLVDKGIDINAHALNGKTALHDAVRLGISDVEGVLTSRGADLDVRDTEGNTPFMETVKAGNYASAERLGKLKADTNTRDNAGNTPLHVAVRGGNIELTRLLLTWNASIHAQNAVNDTPFRLSIKGEVAMVALLVDKRVLLTDDAGASPLNIAIQDRASLDIVKAIVDQGARLSPIDSRGRTPLRIAVDNKDWEVAQFLTERGADVFSIAGDRKSPTDIALLNGEVGIRALFSGRAINAQDSSGDTVLHYAAKRGNSAMVTLLIGLGADKNKGVKNAAGDSPIEVARRWKNTDVELLLN
ncbi:MAG: ankyrin repeat domain-containing protein [Treponema sp.]|jgi:ankyrin repeat protein|nr:ankyrin repeat domain-containing protein [Treponema sp.]